MASNLKFNIRILGVGAIQRRLTWTPADAHQVSLALLESGRIMLDSSKPNVPVLTGNLRSTGKILGPISQQFGFGQRVLVEYGGKASKETTFPAPQALKQANSTIGTDRVTYAAFQHENNPSKSKFLENAFNREAPNVARRIADRLTRVLGRKVRL